MALAQPDRFRRDLDQLALADELDRVLERESYGRGEHDRLVLAGGADVGELLGADRVDHEVVVAGVDADDHSFVYRVPGAHEHAAALLELPQRVGDGDAVVLRHEDPVAALGDLALHRRIVVEHVAHDSRAAGHRQELALEADQPAGRDAVFEPHAALAVGLHVGELAAAPAELFHDHALVRLLDVDRQQLERLAALAVNFLVDDARPRHRELVAFAAHVLEQDREVQLAAPANDERVGIRGEFDAQGDVALDLALEPLAQLAASDEFSLAPGERRGVDEEIHRQRRLVHLERRQRLRMLQVAERHADADFLDAVDEHDVAGLGFIHRGAFQPFELEYLVDACLDRLGAVLQHQHVLERVKAPAADAADADLADIARIIERADLQLQRTLGVLVAYRHVGEDRLEKRLHVDADDGFQPLRERLAQNEPGLRHRPFDRVHQEQHAIDHGEHALDLAAEIRVPGSVDDVDVRAPVADGAVLGEDGDAALALDVVRVHHPLLHVLMRGEGARLLQQLVDQRGLAVIDVGDDGDVAPGASHEMDVKMKGPSIVR